MDRKQNKKLVRYARELRRDMTRQERRLWYDFLRSYPVKFTRQKILGRYIADFFCADARLVIELDGSQHFEDRGPEKDAERTAYLESYGLEILRIANNDVDGNFDGVCEHVDRIVKARTASPAEL